MSTQTALVARDFRLQQWAEQIRQCQNRPADMTVGQWCDQNGISKANYYYRMTQVRKSILAAMPDSVLTEKMSTNTFYDISDLASDENADPLPATVVATIHVRKIQIDLYNSADAGFLHSLLEAMGHAE